MGDIKETSCEYIVGEEFATFYTAEKRWITRINKLKTQYPSSVEIIAQNKDGSILAHIPAAWFRIRPPKQLSECTLEKLRERGFASKNSI